MKYRKPTPTRTRFRLAARYDARTNDLLVDLSPRFGNADLRYLCDIFSREVLAELEVRGYDLSTLRFSIDKTAAAVQEHEFIAGRGAAQ